MTVGAGFRLSPQQEHLLALGARGPVAQCVIALREGAAGALPGAVHRLAARHEILRTTIVRPSGVRVPQQAIQAELSPAVQRLEVGAGELEAALRDEAGAPFDFASGPMLRVLLITRSDGADLLVLTAPAAFLDPAALLIAADELAALSGAGDDDPFGDEPVQYADYAEWRHQLAEEREPAPGAWRVLATEPPSAPRILFARPGAGPHVASARVPVDLDGGLAQAVRASSAALRVPEDAFLEACWHAFLARMSGAEELLVASYGDGRAQADLSRALGAFGQAGPVLTRYEESSTLPEIVDQVRRGRAEAARWHDSARAEDLTRLAEVAGLGFTGYTHGGSNGASGEVIGLRAALAGPWLQCTVVAGPSTLQAELAYDPDVLAQNDARELARRLAILIRGAVAAPEQPVAALPIVQAGERAQLIASGPAAGADLEPVHARFEAQAARHPQWPAVSSIEGNLSYAELDAAANRLAHDLREAGVGADSRVGICLARTPGLLVAVLGIFKAGAAYVPLNPDHPAERLRHQLEESGAAALVTQEHLLPRLPAFGGTTICLDRDAARLAARPATAPPRSTGPEDLAYVIYTSGSTGGPKGVGVTHGNLANYTADMITRLGFDQAPGDRGLRAAYVSSIATDLGNTCLFPALAGGGCVQLISHEGALDADRFVAEVAGATPDVLKITPSHLRALLAGRGAEVLPARWLVLGGEALPWELVDLIAAQSPQCRVLNHYGPTEATIGCCTFALDGASARDDAATVPIGAPITATRAYVLDRHLDPVPAGVAGELGIAGAGVASGYINNAAETAARFREDPLSSGSRMYLTGDRVRRLRDGSIEFLGRVDQQLKIRGFRVEPGEIEVALASHDAVRQAAVVAPEDERGERALIAYVVAAPAPPAAALKEFLAASLPDYMIPARFVALETMPLTPSGKVDRQALLAAGLPDEASEREIVAPRDAVEQEVADIWCELLGLERVSVVDDFFALGGHSLLATQVIMRIRRVHGNIPLHALLGAPTVAALAEIVRGSSIELAT